VLVLNLRLGTQHIENTPINRKDVRRDVSFEDVKNKASGDETTTRSVDRENVTVARAYESSHRVPDVKMKCDEQWIVDQETQHLGRTVQGKQSMVEQRESKLTESSVSWLNEEMSARSTEKTGKDIVSE
jgi:hypothetical protein